MDKYIWTEKYSVDIPSLDEQHKEFFAIANKILAVAKKKDLEAREAFEVLEELGDHAFYHLETEEGYFDKLSYLGAPEHVAAHNEFRKKSMELMDRARKGEEIKKILKETASFSGKWLLEHIIIMDKKYTVYFKEHGVK